jgi:hypothetical protein
MEVPSQTTENASMVTALLAANVQRVANLDG